MNEYLNRKGNTIILLANYFLSLEVGLKVNSIQKFTIDLNVARGTIQESIKFLENKKAIKIEKNGRSGTFLIKKDNKKLFECTGTNYLKGTMPLPYSKRYEGLASGIYSYFNENLNIKFFMSYVRSSLNSSIHMSIFLMLIAVCVTVHIMLLKTLKEKEIKLKI